MSDRFTADTITSDALDALYVRAERAERRLYWAHQARRAKEHQLDEIRCAMCDAEIIEDDDQFGHADLADVIRQTKPGPQDAAHHAARGAEDDVTDQRNAIRRNIEAALQGHAREHERSMYCTCGAWVSDVDEHRADVVMRLVQPELG